MLNKILCALLGHKTVVKAYTGETITQTNGLGMVITGALYRWEKQKFCIRCGKDCESKFATIEERIKEGRI